MSDLYVVLGTGPAGSRVDSSAIERDLCLQAIPLDERMRATVDWFQHMG